jgi:pyruvate dehydrogenase E2 component (dihydrolipoyllysine-residue acetyltransferase)
MAKPIKMPKLSDQMTEGKIAEWMKKEGDEVKAGDVVAQVETEKATLDVEAFESGVLIGVVVKAGETAPVGRPIAWLGARGEKVPEAEAGAAPGGDAAKQEKSGGEVAHVSTQPAPPAETKAPRPEPAAAAPEHGPRPAAERRPQPGPERQAPPPAPSRGARQAPAQAVFREAAPSGRVIASPAARKRARERGVDIAGVEGSGPRGRVILADLERAPAERAEPGRRAQPVAAPPPAGRKRRALPPRVELRDETVPLTPMRKAIARNLAAVKPGAPHYYLEISVDMRRMVALREQLEELSEGPISFNDLIVKASADALSRHPEVNAAWGADAIVHRGSVDVGVAVAIEDGLITPVVRRADEKGVFEIAAEIRDLAARARERRLRPDEYQGGSFTISNLGMFGIEAFYAVINPPEAAILAVGTVQKVPWVDETTGQLVAMERMRLGFSGDHRVIDGATGAKFLQTLKAILESPVRLVVP